MRKLLLLCCLVFSIHTFSHAQLSNNTDDQADGKKLSASLTKNQKAKIGAIYAAQNKNIQLIMRSTAPGDKNQKVMAVMNATTEKVKAVLTPAQAVIYQRLMQQNYPRRK